ncbi:OmpL47-type beta-barrel domain-containing protein [Fredinandcohnia sp. 179-A 10B2 NHS]|uniref:OmpL47-type beta-barrel domain-containing protein n=1 Tax=Fredinandcohnia sp. 179-A 10B2 NHS TaxID=3235176 RepID=UPI00399FB95B
MRKYLRKSITVFALLLMVTQLLFPFGNALANGSMLPPTTITHQEITPDDIKLSWNAVYGATGYQIYEITDGQLLQKGTVTSSSYLFNNLEEGTYTFAISTLTSEGESGPSAPITFTVTYPDMQAPTNLTQSIRNGNDIYLSWGSSKYTEKYNVYEVSKEGNQQLVTSVTGTNHTISNTPEGSYTYVVTAENSLYGESSQSDAVQAEVVYPVMQTPANFTYSISNGNDITFRWNTVSYVTNYKLYKVTEDGKELIETTKNSSYKLSNVAPGTYTYEIQSYSDRFGESVDESGQLQITVDEIKMVAPSNFTYQLVNVNDIKLTWDSVNNATNYKIYQIINGEKVLKSTETRTSVTYSKQEAGEYDFEIHSYSDRFGESVDGSKVSVVVDQVEMEAPSTISYNVKNGNDLVLEWEATSNTTDYKIYQVNNDGTKVLKRTATSTSTTFTNMAEGSYTFMIHSNSTRFGESAEGKELLFSIVYPKMSSPSNVTETIKSETSFSLHWDAVDYATNYKVYQIADDKKVLKSTVTGTSVSYSNMPAGDYTYEIYAYSSRFGESEQGTKVTVTLEGQTMKAPAELAFTTKNGNDVALNWSSVDYATNYNIYEVVNGEKVFKRNTTSKSYTFTNLAEGEYTFVIHSNSTYYGESKYGAEVTVSVVHPLMEKPTNLSFSILNGNDVKLSWDEVEYATSYNVYELIGDDKVFRYNAKSESYTFSNVSEGQHTYVVHSVSERFGESSIGNYTSMDVEHPIMQAPESLSSSILKGNDIKLSWSTVTYATNYNIYRVTGDEKELEKSVTGTSVTFTNLPEGVYKYEVYSNSSRFGESPESSAIEITVVHPIMQKPENITDRISNGNDIILKWNETDYATKYNVYQIIEGEKVYQKYTTGTSISFTNMPEGDYEFIVHSYSDRFGESPDGNKISFRLVHPIMQSPENFRNTISNGNDIVIRWNETDYATGYNLYSVKDGEKILLRSTKGTSSTFTNMAEGDYEYLVHSYSTRFGESPDGSKLDLTLNWPVVQPPQVDADVNNFNNITLSWPAVTWADEYRVYKVTNEKRELINKGSARNYKVYNLTEDSHSFEVTSYSNRFGESQPSNPVTETIIYPLMETPAANLKLLSDTSARISWNFVAYANGYNIYEIINGEKVLVAERINNLSYTLTNLTYANHEYVVTSVSNSFGESEPSDVVLAKLIIDEEAPVTTSNAPTEWVNKSVNVKLTATDNEVGVAKTYYSLGGEWIEGTSFSLEEAGVHEISFYSVDKVGNTEKPQTMEVKIDKTTPETSSNVVDSWNNKGVQVELEASDNLSGVAKTFYSINGSEYLESTSFTVDTEGINEVSFYSVDAAGNVEDTQTIEVKIDKTTPETTSNVVDSWNNKNVQVELTATDNLSGGAKTFYSINGSDYAEGTSFTVVAEGENEVSFYSVDEAGNVENAQTIEVKIDKTAPSTTSNVVNTWNNKDVQVELTATDNLSGVEKTFYSVNGSEYVEGTSFTVNNEQVNEVSFYSLDHAGNQEEVQTLQVKIDKTKPVTTSNVTNTWLKDDFTIDLTATDNLSGIADTIYSINGKGSVSGLNTIITKEGISNVSFYSIDNAGNIEDIQTAQVKLDKTAPTVKLDVAEEYTLGTKLPLTYVATDNLSGIATEKMTVNGQVVQNGEVVSFNQPGEYVVEVDATDNAGWTTTIKKTVLVYIPATIEVLPKVMNGNKGVFTVKVDLPMGYSTKNLDLDAATLNGVSAQTSNKGYYKQAEQGQFKFERQDFYWIPGQTTMKFVGKIGNFIVKGQTDVKVIK